MVEVRDLLEEAAFNAGYDDLDKIEEVLQERIATHYKAREAEVKDVLDNCTCPKPLPRKRRYYSQHYSNCPIFKAEYSTYLEQLSKDSKS